jgi:hypothetical protein
LARTLDLVVNSSGLTDFNPDLREALASNVGPVLHLIEFLRASDHAGLLHLSTCYVVGAKDGRVSEEVQPNYTPLGNCGFRCRARVALPAGSGGARRGSRRKPGDHGGAAPASAGKASRERRTVRSRTRKSDPKKSHALAAQSPDARGTRRARRLGWPNTYTLTKSLAESLIVRHGPGCRSPSCGLRLSKLPPTSRFRGWNEGINTSAPLSYLLGTYFRQLPTNERKCLDVIPVDMVCRGMTLIAAAIIARRHEPIYQLATSEQSVRHGALHRTDRPRAPQALSRAAEPGELDAHAVRHHSRLQIALREIFGSRAEGRGPGINRAASALQMKKPPLARQERDLARVEKLIELYEPFILHNEQVFESENVQLLSAALPEDERAAFSYDPSAIDWWEYWINIHIPALRRWVYPLIEGRAPESHPRRVFSPQHEPEMGRSAAKILPHAGAASGTGTQA